MVWNWPVKKSIQLQPPVRSFFDKNALDHGFVVSNQFLPDLVIGKPNDAADAAFIYPAEIFVQRKGNRLGRVQIPEDLPYPYLGISLSRDGKYAIVNSITKQIPVAWKPYTLCAQPDYRGLRYLLIDTKQVSARPLVSGNGGAGTPNPGNNSTKIVWLSDGKSVVVPSTYLPLDDLSAAERAMRANTAYTLEVNAETGAVTTVAEGDLDVAAANPARNMIFLTKHSNKAKTRDLTAYQKIQGTWQKVGASSETEAIAIVQEQYMNTPPRLFVVDPKTSQKALLLDLNPSFHDLRFSRVEAITWKGSDGHEAKGGLYLPADYLPGKRYPLVIQTHGWNPELFEIDGASTAGYAAQALAGKGIVVVQMDENYGDAEGTEQEGPMQMRLYQALIDYLDNRGLIDHMRVGLMAWSRTGFGVRYALAFAKYPIAAASIVDGMEGSYFQYMIDLPFDDLQFGGKNLYEALQGGDPLRGALPNWEKNAPGFNLDKVKAPIRILGFGSYSLVENNWEWFAGLRHLHKPVEMIWLRNALHLPVRPSERLTAQQGNVDWFCFWLKTEEDPDPSKAEQYARWRELRKQQEAASVMGVQQ